MTRNEVAARQMHLWCGLFPLLVDDQKVTGLVSGDAWIQDVENRVQKAIDLGTLLDFLKKGDNVVVVTGWRGGSGNTNTLRIIQV